MTLLEASNPSEIKNRWDREFWTNGKMLAKIIKIDDEAFSKLVDLTSDLTDNSWLDFAIVPFPWTYVEFNQHGILTDGETIRFIGLTANDLSIGITKYLYDCNSREIRHVRKHEKLNMSHDKIVDISIIVHAISMLFVLMARGRGISFRDMPATTRIEKQAIRHWKAHSVATIDLRERDRKLIFKTGFKRGGMREHDVRATLVHYPESQRKSSCIHNYILMDTLTSEGGKRWRCEHCHGLRVERKSFVRGDPKLGTKFHTYNVKV